MTRQEAIKILEKLSYPTERIGEALDMAIKALDIVECRECVKRKKNKFCLEHMRYERDDGYCSYGERRSE